MLRLFEEKIATSLGPLQVVCNEQFHLRATEWEEYSERAMQLLDIHCRKEGYEHISVISPGSLSDKLREYLAGDPSIIDMFPTATEGTLFQREVWKTLRAIPCGQVMHYGQLAEQLGRPSVVRAVDATNGPNPISTVVPCHRVIGRNGTMTGYTGGAQRKEQLLRHKGYPLLQTLDNLYQLVYTFI